MKKNIKKGKITVIITMIVVCFALTLVMSMQFKIVNQTDITSIENMREAELRTERANWKSKYEETNQKYEKKKKKIEEYKTTSQSNEETGKLVDEELEQVNLSLGKTDVQGQGIEVTLRETDNEEIARINGDDLIVINMSDIADINETFIKVNGKRILAPYIIKAIGNSSHLETALIGNGGHVDEMKKIGQDVSIDKLNRVKILKYNEDIKLKYAQ